MTGAFPAKSLQSRMKRLDSNSPNGLGSEPQAETIRCAVDSPLLSSALSRFQRCSLRFRLAGYLLDLGFALIGSKTQRFQEFHLGEIGLVQTSRRECHVPRLCRAPVQGLGPSERR